MAHYGRFQSGGFRAWVLYSRHSSGFRGGRTEMCDDPASQPEEGRPGMPSGPVSQGRSHDVNLGGDKLNDSWRPVGVVGQFNWCHRWRAPA